MKLVIVESPNKCHTISRYLGEGYQVLATVGHLRDLSTSGKGGFGVDIQNDFKPTYVVSSGKRGTVNELKEAARKADDIYLATDPDREGEAIAWHLTQILGLDPKTTKRLEFHEITRVSINNAIKHPRTLDMNLVESQETRRIMDRIIGFRLSNIIQKKIKSPSAGRVQSATLELICDHDKEIAEFKPEPYWSLSIELKKNNAKISANFHSFSQIKKIETPEVNAEILKILECGKAKVTNVKKSTRVVESKPAFTTSTLQQEAFNTYKFSTKKTSSLAQQLYEGVQIKGEHTGLITYIRTDSTYLSDTFVERAENFISKKFGPEYCGKRKVVAVAGAQNAHEAIRPTANHTTPESVKPYLTPDQYKLYKLIYERALSSLMAPKKEAVTQITFDVNGVTFKTESSSVVFDGYTRLLGEESEASFLPVLSMDEELPINKVNNEQKFTEPPASYTEAKIVKLMEDKKIGRPSTYATTIATLLKREYVVSKSGVITTTEQGQKTAHVLRKYFPKFVDVKYTAQMEETLDQIQEGEVSRTDALTSFYYPFIESVEDASQKMYKDADEQTGRTCPKCGAPLVYKKSKFGNFIGCSNFPACSYREKEEEELEKTGEMCPVCGKPLVYRVGKRGKKFVACSGYPDCNYIKKEEVTVEVVKKCPECGGDLVIRGSGKKKFLGCSNFPKCHHIEKLDK